VIKVCLASSYPSSGRIANCRVLRTLELRLGHVRVEESGATIAWIARFLLSSQPPSTVATIEVDLSFNLTLNSTLILPASIDWASLADALDPARYPVLESFALSIRGAFVGSTAYLDLMHQQVKQGLHQLDARGALKCTIKVARPSLWDSRA
jgi:hypothetical protein